MTKTIMTTVTVADGKREARYSAWLTPSAPLLVVDLMMVMMIMMDDDNDG